MIIRDADSHHFNADKDPDFYFNADKDPDFHFNADPNPEIPFYANPDPAPNQSDGNHLETPGLHR
jgi:hypothetical protein